MLLTCSLPQIEVFIYFFERNMELTSDKSVRFLVTTYLKNTKKNRTFI